MMQARDPRVIANPLDIERYQVEFYNLAKSVKGANRRRRRRSGLSNFEQLVELGKTGKPARRQRRAHRAASSTGCGSTPSSSARATSTSSRAATPGIVRFRIDGVLHQVYQIPPSVLAAMTSRIKILGAHGRGREAPPAGRPHQDAHRRTGDEIELRLSTLPTAFGEKLVMRIFDPEVLVRDFKELGFSEDDHERWKEMTDRPNGIVLVTGPTGSGKTTTLYSTLKNLATPEVNVCTIEDPIEMVEPAFNQMQVQHADRARLRRGRARAHAPGPRHHHGGRDPRPGDRRDGDAGRAHRPPRALDAAHQRRAERDDAPARARRAGLPAQRHAERHHGAAPGAHALPALQAEDRAAPRRGRDGVGRAGRALEVEHARRSSTSRSAASSAA